MKNYYFSMRFPKVGVIRVARMGGRHVRISFGGSLTSFLDKLPDNNEWEVNEKKFRTLIRKLEKFFRGESVPFDERIEILLGSNFQQDVWMEIRKIPWGETKSYLELAKSIGRPKAYRAVANACGTNPLPIIIPCHRVIASGGNIGGFSAGLKLKKHLLKLEGTLF